MTSPVSISPVEIREKAAALVGRPLSVPLRLDDDGVIRVGATRVTLDTVIGAFHQGASAEEIVQQYPTVGLADAYLVIGFYLRHTAEADGYLAARQRHGEAVRAASEANFRGDRATLRQRLLARLAAKPPAAADGDAAWRTTS